MRLWGGVILRWFYFKNKTDFTHLPPPTHEPTRTERSVPRHVALWPGTKEHSRGHAVWTRLPTAMLGKSPITPPASSQACSPVLGLGVLFGADTGLRFLSLQPCFSSFCNYLSMKSSVIPHCSLSFILVWVQAPPDWGVLRCVSSWHPFSAIPSIPSASRHPHSLSVHTNLTVPTKPLCNGVPWKHVLHVLQF